MCVFCMFFKIKSGLWYRIDMKTTIFLYSFAGFDMISYTKVLLQTRRKSIYAKILMSFFQPSDKSCLSRKELLKFNSV